MNPDRVSAHFRLLYLVKVKPLGKYFLSPIYRIFTHQSCMSGFDLSPNINLI